MKKVKVAVVGVGFLGQHHARVYSELDEVELVGVVDSNKTRAEQIADLYNTKPYTDYRDIIDKVEAVNIAVPTVQHCETASEFLKNKVHVLVEKPITSTVDEAKELLALSREHNVIIQVGHIERFNSAIINLASRITDPKFIEVDRLAPFPFRGTDVSVVLDLMIHDIDIILSLVKNRIVNIDAAGVSVFSNSEDIANARLTFENGCKANITASRISIDNLRKIRIFEPETYYSVDYMAQEIKICKKKKGIDVSKETNFLNMIEIENIKIEKEEPLKLELKSFINCLLKGETPVVPGEFGSYALKIAMDIIKEIRGN